jgi:hypothetical protein
MAILSAAADTFNFRQRTCVARIEINRSCNATRSYLTSADWTNSSACHVRWRSAPPIKKNRGLDLEKPGQRVHVLDAELSFAGEDFQDRRVGEFSSASDIALRLLVGLDQKAQHVGACNRRDRHAVALDRSWTSAIQLAGSTIIPTMDHQGKRCGQTGLGQKSGRVRGGGLEGWRSGCDRRIRGR